ncbi:class I SAM-dependent methyltransferase [Mesorhizobium sp. LHD-90]|uniref:class I SAM-dependent methyltransferase n=1 Tax=Mesorhizobium sp. LHD-90 TaxID=3071414 RepID=UPI0027DFB916|nr:class I SAM-dependent methyltransferase [Mesorhizobium sp. LHD-90]MDQ6436949.1 class I SAM-dependent methyltransferase [Mesorhizobium sp. LHD-90]
MADLEEGRADRAGIQDRSSGRLGRAIRILRERGPLEPFRLVRRHGLSASTAFVGRNIRHLMADRLARKWDRDHNVDTAGSIQLAGLQVVGPHRDQGNECLCTSPKTFDFIMRSLPADLSDCTFIDIGAGKSRTLLLASRYPFAKVVGVEFAHELVEIAKRNVETFRDPAQKCRNIEVVEADAAAYEFPKTPLVVYFYNPFSKQVFDIVIQNLVASLRETDRDCHVVYGSSSHAAIDWAKPAILTSGAFEQLATPPMPGFLDAVRTIDYAVFRYRGKNG